MRLLPCMSRLHDTVSEPISFFASISYFPTFSKVAFFMERSTSEPSYISVMFSLSCISCPSFFTFTCGLGTPSREVINVASLPKRHEQSSNVFVNFGFTVALVTNRICFDEYKYLSSYNQDKHRQEHLDSHQRKHQLHTKYRVKQNNMKQRNLSGNEK